MAAPQRDKDLLCSEFCFALNVWCVSFYLFHFCHLFGLCPVVLSPMDTQSEMVRKSASSSSSPRLCVRVFVCVCVPVKDTQQPTTLVMCCAQVLLAPRKDLQVTRILRAIVARRCGNSSLRQPRPDPVRAPVRCGHRCLTPPYEDADCGPITRVPATNAVTRTPAVMAGSNPRRCPAFFFSPSVLPRGGDSR